MSVSYVVQVGQDIKQLKNIAPHVHLLLSYFSSICRSISPTLFGSLYSWSLGNEGKHGFPINHFFSFVSCGFFALLTLSLAVTLPPDIDGRKHVVEEDDDLPERSASSVQLHCENKQTTV